MLTCRLVTDESTIVGTFQYMSREQVEGKELDARSDIFSLGAVLYEMLTGQHAFTGKSQLRVASAILENEPEPISTIKPLTPARAEFRSEEMSGERSARAAAARVTRRANLSG
jgi:serine/threonine protein kinase